MCVCVTVVVVNGKGFVYVFCRAMSFWTIYNKFPNCVIIHTLFIIYNNCVQRRKNIEKSKAYVKISKPTKDILYNFLDFCYAEKRFVYFILGAFSFQ